MFNNSSIKKISLACLLFALPLTSVLADSLKVTTWNMEWLTIRPVASIPESRRDGQDFSLLNSKIQNINPDILAFQEVDSKAAIQKVVGPFYRIYLSDRSFSSNKDQQFSDINQYTGFAISSRFKVTDPRDLELTKNSKLRFASYVVLNRIGEPDVHLLSVHLKQGCVGQKTKKTACTQVLQQAKELNQWMTKRLTNNDAFIVMGDFNHNLSFHNDWLWQVLKKGIEKQVELVTETTPALCQVQSNKDKNEWYRYPRLIDHIIISKPSRGQQGEQVLFTREEALHHHLSDHCPVVSHVDVRAVE
ncbi:endonuclease/exonuclease/phosphatase family protein [Vibrio rumoiensis]|uniref:Hydrolase n=1 Tax=Vibrio rumoiensis 1S-45 TaxID=1188252 RepID=A0A1E5DZ74_9VIBR|nr:endonuclease/exonuclease/phosphatase family protein [Vibrio rumoiensis]OEF23203.1 hydrolase [Vibrio rumoiensis 1S-45]